MVKLISRSEWGARSARSVVTFSPFKPPTGHWNGPTVTVRGSTTWDHKFCSALVRGIQNFHMDSRGWADIAYNWLVCPHGYIYEGRGLWNQNGANGTTAANKVSAAICFIAGQGNTFTNDEKQAFKDCIEYVSRHTTSPAGAIGHRDHKSTECPGDARYNWIRSGMPVTGPLKKEMFVFESHEARVAFVKKCYRNIADREADQGGLNFWVYVIALNPANALELILDLHGGEHKAA